MWYVCFQLWLSWQILFNLMFICRLWIVLYLSVLLIYPFQMAISLNQSHVKPSRHYVLLLLLLLIHRERERKRGQANEEKEEDVCTHVPMKWNLMIHWLYWINITILLLVPAVRILISLKEYIHIHMCIPSCWARRAAHFFAIRDTRSVMAEQCMLILSRGPNKVKTYIYIIGIFISTPLLHCCAFRFSTYATELSTYILCVVRRHSHRALVSFFISFLRQFSCFRGAGLFCCVWLCLSIEINASKPFDRKF